MLRRFCDLQAIRKRRILSEMFALAVAFERAEETMLKAILVATFITVCTTDFIGQTMADDSVKKCLERCETLCGYFPDHRECRMEVDRCTSRCKYGAH
jgi:hypothetical protein